MAVQLMIVDSECLQENARILRGKNRAFTIVELLVVIAICGVLLSLLLPAVQNAREAARRLQCQSNLRQLGVAALNYDLVYRALPMGCLESRLNYRNPPGRQFAWSALVLPFLEQQGITASIDFRFAYDHSVNRKARNQNLAIFVCPSATKKRHIRGRTDYGGVYGQRITARQDTNNGIYLIDQEIRSQDILDGMSNTLAIAEDTIGPDSQWINGQNIFEISTFINNSKAWIYDNEIRSEHVGGAMVVFADARPVFLSSSTDIRTLAAMVTRGGGDAAFVE